MTRSGPTLGIDRALARLLSPDVLSTDVSVHAVDGTVPLLVARPATQSAVAAVLGVANANDTAVIPWGGGTQMGLGMQPARYELALDLRALARVVEYEPADLTVTLEAGMTLSNLQRLLAERGQWLPLDPPVSSEATIGGILATNASGPARITYGTLRDLLIGITIATAGGELVKAGGRVVKNVAGYDLGKLQIGALGTLGVIVQASFKIAPLPAATKVLVTESANLRALMSIAFAVRDASLPTNGMVLFHGPERPGWGLSLRFAGGAAAVERAERELQTLGGQNQLAFAFAADLLPAHPDAFEEGTETPVAVKASVLPTTLSSVLEDFAHTDASIVAYPTAGILHTTWPAETVDAAVLKVLRRLCVEKGHGSLVIESGPLELKRAIDIWGETRGDFSLMRRLKAEFDPKGTLNPGRFVGGI